MFGVKRLILAQHERGLLFRDRAFETILEPGVHRFFDPLKRIEVQVFDLTEQLIKRGYSDANIRLVLGGNFRRLLGATWS